MNTLTPSQLTPSQRDTLVRLRRKAKLAPDYTVDLNEFGSKGSVGHLIRKGAVRVERTEIGPRGGEYPFVALTDEGRRVADYIVVNGLKTW